MYKISKEGQVYCTGFHPLLTGFHVTLHAFNVVCVVNWEVDYIQKATLAGAHTR